MTEIYYFRKFNVIKNKNDIFQKKNKVQRFRL